MPASASAISPSTRNAGHVSQPRAAALQGIDKMRSNLGAGAGPGHFRAAAAAGAGLAGGARHDDRGCRAAHRRQCDERLGDVGGQCRDGQPGARHGRRQMPPDGRQSEDHAAPQPRMAGDAGPAAARVRRRRIRGARPGAARVRRRGRGQSYAAGARRMASRAWKCSSMALPGGPFPARQHIEASKAIARLHRLDPERTMFAAQSEEAIAAGAFHNDVVAVANGPVLFAHEKAFADRDALVDELGGQGARLRAGRGARCRSAAGRRHPQLFVQRPAGDSAGRGDDAGRADRMPRHAVGRSLDRAAPRLQRRDPAGRISSMSASRWPMAAARPACACASQCDPADVDPRFLVDEAKLDRLAEVIVEAIGRKRLRRPTSSRLRWSPTSSGPATHAAGGLGADRARLVRFGTAAESHSTRLNFSVSEESLKGS